MRVSHIARQFASHMKEYGYTQQQAAARLGISAASLNRILHGNTGTCTAEFLTTVETAMLKCIDIDIDNSAVIEARLIEAVNAALQGVPAPIGRVAFLRVVQIRQADKE